MPPPDHTAATCSCRQCATIRDLRAIVHTQRDQLAGANAALRVAGRRHAQLTALIRDYRLQNAHLSGQVEALRRVVFGGPVGEGPG